MEDIEEHVTDAWKDADMPTKVSTEPPANATDMEVATKALKQKSFRQDVKKAKAHMVRASKHFPKRLIMESNTPYQAHVALKTKCSVSKNRHDFTKLDKEWEKLKVKDTSTDQD